MPRDWKELSKAASREQDSKKLLELVEELDKALEQHENSMKEKKRGPTDSKTDKSNLHPLVLPRVHLSA